MGPVETSVRQRCEDSTHPLAQIAYALARKLDDDAGMATAAISKELRATLEALDEAAPIKQESAVDDIAARRAARRAAG